MKGINWQNIAGKMWLYIEDVDVVWNFVCYCFGIRNGTELKLTELFMIFKDSIEYVDKSSSNLWLYLFEHVSKNIYLKDSVYRPQDVYTRKPSPPIPTNSSHMHRKKCQNIHIFICQWVKIP